jgi:hypothetical protein
MKQIRIGHKPSISAGPPTNKGQTIPQVFELIIKCESEQHQRTLYHRLAAEGLKCRLSIL